VHLHAAVLLRLYLLPLPIQQHPSICCPAVSPCPLHVCSLRPPREQQLTLVACVAVWSRVLVFTTARCVVSASSTAKKTWWPHLGLKPHLGWLCSYVCVGSGLLGQDLLRAGAAPWQQQSHQDGLARLVCCTGLCVGCGGRRALKLWRGVCFCWVTSSMAESQRALHACTNDDGMLCMRPPCCCRLRCGVCNAACSTLKE
jgi:hypothetical protein